MVCYLWSWDLIHSELDPVLIKLPTLNASQSLSHYQNSHQPNTEAFHIANVTDFTSLQNQMYQQYVQILTTSTIWKDEESWEKLFVLVMMMRIGR
jgi:hypothetical protein